MTYFQYRVLETVVRYLPARVNKNLLRHCPFIIWSFFSQVVYKCNYLHDLVNEKGNIAFLKIMQKHYLVICLLELFTNVNCGLLLNHLPAILQEFKISHPVLANTILPVEKTTKLLKILSHHGYSISLLRQIEDINKQYQSYLIFSKINDLHWNFRTDAPSLIVTEIQNETDLNQVEVSIGNEVLFLDRNSMKVYEAYDVNQVHVIKYLGLFQEDDKSRVKFIPSENYDPSIVHRRKNFHGLLFKGIALLGGEDPINHLTNVKYHPNNDTYDITNLITTNPDISYDPKLCLLYTSPSPRDLSTSRMPSSA